MGGSPSRPAPPAVAPPATSYKRIPRWQIDDYNTALEAYNRRFTGILVISNDKMQISSANYTTNYNPPMPPWMTNGSADSDFIYRVDAYRSQLLKVRETVQEINRNMVANAYMIDVLNTPPTPMPPESIYISNDPRPVPVAASASVALGPGGRPLSSEEAAYKVLFEDGRVLLRGAGITNYEAAVPYNPPVAGEGRRRVDEKLFELRDLLRKLYAERTGLEPANLVFPVSILTREGFSGRQDLKPTPAQQAEGFAGQDRLNPKQPAQQAEGFSSASSAPIKYNGKLYKCANLTDYQLWQGRTFHDKGKLCSAYGYTFIPGYSTAACPCYEYVGVVPTSNPVSARVTAPPPTPIIIDTGEYNTSLAPEPETGSLYNYNSPSINLSYNIPEFTGYNGDSYKTHMAAQSTIRKINIEEYYNHLNVYNHWWLRLNGWKVAPYNPPRPFWYADNSTDTEAVAYKRAITVFNSKVDQKKAIFESLGSVNLPADFGQLPALPPYPNTLHDLLENPAKYADPARASALPSVPGGAGGSSSTTQPVVEFQIPVADVSKILTYVKQKPPPPPQTRPKCGSESPCVKYKEPPAMVKKFLEDRSQQLREQRAMNDRINSYTMDAPRASNRNSNGTSTTQTTSVNTNTLKQLRESIMRDLGSFTSESMCNE